MSQVEKSQKVGVEEHVEAKIHRIRITLTSRNVKNLEKVSADPSNVPRTSNLRSRVLSVSPPRCCVSLPVSPLAVTVPKPSTVSKCASTSV
ncbi:unnamed protein product [Absidia cylindrospora]